MLSQGAMNETLLLPNNTVVRGGFANLAEKFTNIPDPSNFADQLVDIATRKSQLPGDGSPGSVREAALVLLEGFASSHILETAVHFYADQSVCT